MRLLVVATESISAETLDEIVAADLASDDDVTVYLTASGSGAPRDRDPLVAVDDAMRVFAPDRVLVVKHPGGDARDRGEALAEHVRERVDVPVECRDVTG